MATDQPGLPVNGNFIPGQQPPYDIGMHNGIQPSSSVSTNAPEYVTSGAQQSSGGDLSKDEVGWYFVEQYYTTMSKSPEKLYLFYNKRSQFVSGSETERLDVCVGQKAINDRIKALDIQDCKVRVTNVDAQGSGQNIVIQVIGEMSTKKQPQHKYTQTFVLAEQTNGYFVLNDIFRYIVDDEYDELEELQRPQNDVATGYQEPTNTAVAEQEPHTLTNSGDPTAREHDAQLVDQGLKEVAQQDDTAVAEPAAAPAVNGNAAAETHDAAPVEDTAAPVASADTETAATTVPESAPAVQEEEVKQPERPTAPESTPAVSPPKQKPAQPVPAAAPAMPKTWATMAAAANRGKAMPVPQSQAPTQPTATASTKAAPAAQPQAESGPGPAVQEPEQQTTPQAPASEWQTAARDSKKPQRPQGAAAPAENSRAYMKNVTSTISEEMLKEALGKYGKLTYFDINRQKSCAFADFETPAAYKAAVSANPHEINGERVFVEERRVRPASFGGMGPRGNNMGPQRGNFAPRGRGGPFPPRGGRGGNTNRGRGGGALSQAA